VDGLHVVDGAGVGFNKGADAADIRKLVVKRLTGNLTDKTLAALNIASGEIDEWEFSDIRLTGGLLYNESSSLTNVPDTLKIDGFTVRGQSATEADDDVVAVKKTSTTPSIVQLHNGSIKDMYYGFRAEADLARLELHNVEMDRNFQHVIFDGTGGAFEVAYIKARGCSFLRARHVATQGPFVFVNSATLDVLDVDGLDDDSDPILIGAGASVNTLVLGTLKTHAGVSNLVGAGTGNEIEVLSGSLEDPRILRGNGSPEGAVTARIGAIYLQKDGAAGNVLWVKETGTSNTGWVNK
jgi:hypothetical protein